MRDTHEMQRVEENLKKVTHNELKTLKNKKW